VEGDIGEDVKKKVTVLTFRTRFFSALHSALCLFGVMLLALSFRADAQQPKKIPRVGYVAGTAENPNVEAFRQGLRDLGYIEGKNILVEYRYLEGNWDRVPSIVNELMQLKVDVFVSSNFPTIRAAKQATKTIPIVIVITLDPVATGIIDSLARPGGNITGVTTFMTQLSGKRLELLTELIPRISRVGILWDANSQGPTIHFKEYEAAGRALKKPLQSLEVRGPNPDLEGAFQAAAKERANALITIANPVLTRYRRRIADLAIKNRLPSMCETSQYVDAGCLLSYAADDAESYKRGATFVDRILKGTKPSDLPVEQPTKFELVVNLKTAKSLGLAIPSKVLMWADTVIE
jgi:putative tryptophan/tyrosine transport system substrate-binding protein